MIQPRRKTFALTLALLLVPSLAAANYFDCDSVAAVFDLGDAAQADATAFSAIGSVDMLGDLLCFTGDARCACLRQITQPATSTAESLAFGEALMSILQSCKGTAQGIRSFSGMAQEAALSVCPQTGGVQTPPTTVR